MSKTGSTTLIVVGREERIRRVIQLQNAIDSVTGEIATLKADEKAAKEQLADLQAQLANAIHEIDQEKLEVADVGS